MPRRLRAPSQDQEILADPPFAQVPQMLHDNQLSLKFFGLDSLRLQARRELQQFFPQLPLDAPLLMAGHQPEFSHPGVWVKHFALSGLARQCQGVGINLIVDNDIPKSHFLNFPTWASYEPNAIHSGKLAFDEPAPAGWAFEHLPIQNEHCWASFVERMTANCQSWGYPPLFESAWPRLMKFRGTFAERVTALRVEMEHRWGGGNFELPVSQMCQMPSFRNFAEDVLRNLPEFQKIYNQAIRDYRREHRLKSASHPVPELRQQGDLREAPFWRIAPGQARQPVWFRAGQSMDDVPWSQIRPRALTLTLFVRGWLADFFIHGIGGGKYDELTDVIFENYYSIKPPTFQILTATLHLPLPNFTEGKAEVHHHRKQLRRQQWNPQEFLPESELAQRKGRLIPQRPEDREARRRWYRNLQTITRELRQELQTQIENQEMALHTAQQQAAANAILQRRDYPWLWFPEAKLRPFLQRFMELSQRL